MFGGWPAAPSLRGVPLGPEPRVWLKGGDKEMGEPQHKHRGTATSPAPSRSSTIDEDVPITIETEDAASKNASCSSLIRATLPACSQAEMFD